MSKHNDLLYLGHMVEYGRRAHDEVSRVSREEFDANGTLQLPVTHLIQIVGEAARKVSLATREAHPEIDWSRVTGMRHKIVHDYIEIDVGVVWDTATNDLPPLIAALEKFTPPEPPSA